VRILYSYILRQHLVPFLLGFGVVTFILEMNTLFDYLDLMVNRGVAVGVVAQLFSLSLGYIVAMSVPCAVLVAVLMTFGRLSQDNEITALSASGVNLIRILMLPLGGALVVAVGLSLFNNYVLPETNHAFANLMIDIGRMRPTVKLQEGVFIGDLPGYNLLVQRVNGRTNEMHGITIYELNPGGPPTTILAKSGFLSYTPDGRTAVMELKDGEIHDIPSDEGGTRKYRRLEFKTHVIYIANAGAILERTVRDTRTDREMSAATLIAERRRLEGEFHRVLESRRERFLALGVRPELLAWVTEETPWGMATVRRLRNLIARREDPVEQLFTAQPLVSLEADTWHMERRSLRRRIAGLSVEIHKKFSLPAACIVFVLVGAPIGMRVRRAGPAVAFVSIVFFLFYYLCLVGGEELANRLLLAPWISMWLPNLVLGWWGIDWTLKACELRRPSPVAAPPAPAAA